MHGLMIGEKGIAIVVAGPKPVPRDLSDGIRGPRVVDRNGSFGRDRSGRKHGIASTLNAGLDGPRVALGSGTGGFTCREAAMIVTPWADPAAKRGSTCPAESTDFPGSSDAPTNLTGPAAAIELADTSAPRRSRSAIHSPTATTPVMMTAMTDRKLIMGRQSPNLAQASRSTIRACLPPGLASAAWGDRSHPSR